MSDTSPIILGDENRLISELQSTTLQVFFEENATQGITIDGGISATTSFGVPEGVIHIESQGGISSTIALGTFAVNQVLTASTIASTTSVSTPEVILSVEDPNYTKTTAVGNPAVFTPEALIQSFANTQISEYQDTQVQNMPPRQLVFEDVVTGGIASTAQFGDFTTFYLINDFDVASTAVISTDAELQQTLTVDDGIATTVVFGVPEGVLTLEEPLVSSTLNVGNPGVIDTQTTIFPYRDEQIGDFENTQIDALPPRQLIFEDIEDGGITSTVQFSNDANLLIVISPESITSTITFDTDELVNTIEDPTSIVQTTQFGDLVSGGLLEPTSIDPTVAFGVPEGVIHIESQGGIASTVALSTDAEIKQTVKDVGAIGTTLSFGLSEGVLQIEEPPLIASTTTFGTPVVTKLISNIGGIGSTVSFPAPIFEGSIFRALIYKDGEISGIGSGEAMYIAGGIRLNPSSRITSTAAAGEATLPSNPVGFMSVDIDGTEYRIPYYNAD